MDDLVSIGFIIFILAITSIALVRLPPPVRPRTTRRGDAA